MIIEHNGIEFFKTNNSDAGVKDKILDDIAKDFVPDFDSPSYGFTVEDFQSYYDEVIGQFLTEYNIEGNITKRQIHYTRYKKGIAQDIIAGTDKMFEGTGFQLIHFVQLDEEHPAHAWRFADPVIEDLSINLVEGDIVIYPNQEIKCYSNVNNLDKEKIVVYYNFNITRL